MPRKKAAATKKTAAKKTAVKKTAAKKAPAKKPAAAAGGRGPGRPKKFQPRWKLSAPWKLQSLQLSA